jgi:hypothetical protein
MKLIGTAVIGGGPEQAKLFEDQPPSRAKVILTRDSLKSRYNVYKIPLWLYVLDALEIDRQDGLIKSDDIDVTVFCQRWGIDNEADFTSAIAQLQKKGENIGFTQLHLNLNVG